MIRYINYLAIFVFALAAIVQFNDIDSFRWMLVYGAASGLSILFTLKKLHWAAATLLGVICLGWALSIIPDLSISGFQNMFNEVSMNQTGVEAGREFLGLFIITIWMIILTLETRKRKKGMMIG